MTTTEQKVAHAAASRAQLRASGPRCGPGDPEFAERYRAIDAHDTRFDGQFFTAVTSTGIYCRPSCPAATPKAEHVTFFLTSAAAHEAGYRACQRCLPEATPGTPAWDLRGDLAGRAMRLIGDGVVDREGVDGLAACLGYTARHVHRLLVTELGTGPLALARARRAQTARALLVGTDLPMAQIAFAAGFSSVRQFNDTIREVFAARPGQVRDRSARLAQPGPRTAAEAAGTEAAEAEAGAVRLDLELPVRQPFDAPGTFAFLASRAIEGVEAAELSDGAELRYARTLALPGGPGAVDLLATRSAQGSWRLRADLELASVADVATAVARLRRLLDLDADPVAIDTALSADADLAPLIARTPGIRVPGAADPYELLVRALVGQQISVPVARSHLSRLTASAGSVYRSAFAGLDRLFPTPAQLLRRVPEPAVGEPPEADRPLRLPARSVRAVRQASAAVADGEVGLHVGAEGELLREQLIARPGIGPWTASYVAMRVLGDPDAWLQGDVALVAGAKAIGLVAKEVPKAPAHRVLADRAADWAPWRSYAAMHLWRAAARAAGN